MKVLELMHSLEEAYDRFGDIDVIIDVGHPSIIAQDGSYNQYPSELIIHSDEFIIKCE